MRDMGKVLAELFPSLDISWPHEGDPDEVTVSFTGTDEEIMQFCCFLQDANAKHLYRSPTCPK